jgi:ankyrin repeat protein
MEDPKVREYLDAQWHIAGFEDLDRIEIDSRDIGGNTPLHIAIHQGNREAARLLILAGADVNAVGEDYFTPLHTAIWDGSLELVHLMIARGADQNLATLFRETAAEMIRQGLARGTLR